MDIKLTNGRKIIVKDKKYYEANLNHFERNGFVPVDSVKKVISGSVDKSKLEALFEKNLKETKEELKKINS